VYLLIIVCLPVALAAAGATEQVVSQWQRPVASEVALDMPHQVMLSVLLRRICKAFETGRNGGAF
jgi:hypothetical protein